MNRLLARPKALLGASAAALALGLTLPGAASAQGVEIPAGSSLTPSAPVTEGAPPRGYAWGGAWISNHYAGGYAGVMQSLSSDRSLWEDGYVLRLDANGGGYSYSAPGFVDRNVGFFDGDVMVGYRKSSAAGNFGGYMGLVHISHDNADPAAPIRGSKTGVAAAGEYSNTFDKRVEVALQGRYASPFSTWSASGRALWKVTDYAWLGPQVTYVENDAPYKEMTVGPLLKFNTSFGEVGISGGYRHPIDSDAGDGYFASVYLSVPVR